MKDAIKIGVCLLFIGFWTSCSINDPIDDWARIGHVTPHTYWELSGDKIKAGENLSFKAQYYTNSTQVDHVEVWYDINQSLVMSASCPIVTFNYSLTINSNTKSREMQSIASYPHSDQYWDPLRKAYILSNSFPISNTLRPVEWKSVDVFDQEKFNLLFPDTFAAKFKSDLYVEIMKPARLPDLRKLMVDLALMTTDEFYNHTDSTWNENSSSYDHFLKAEATPIVKEKYDGIPFKDLIYSKSELKYQVDYLRSYFLNSVFKVYDSQKNEGVSETKKIEIF